MQCATMIRRTVTMNWDGLREDDDDDRFFESYERISSVVPQDLASSGSDEDEEFEDSRMSFASALSSTSMKSGFHRLDPIGKSLVGYDMWMTEPGDIRERRKRLLQGMGLASTKDMLRLASSKIVGAVSKIPDKRRLSIKVDSSHKLKVDSSHKVKVDSCPKNELRRNEPQPGPSPSLDSHQRAIVLARSRSDGDIDAFSDRQVVDWTDLHEMVTAASYTPDGQGAIIGSHQGICRIYSIDDCKLEHQNDIHMKIKSQAKKLPGFQSPAQAKKITGFQVHNLNSKLHLLPVQAHEQFHCKDVSVAIPWPGSTKVEPPIVEIHSKRHSKRSTYPSPNCNSPTVEDAGASSRRHMPPLPKKNNGLDRITSCGDDDFAHSGRIDPGIGVSHSFGSSSASISYGDSPSISASATSPSQSWSTSWSLFDNGGGHGGQTVQATAWGLVIVAASLEGEIRVYQNFGLPLKVSRQANLFRD